MKKIIQYIVILLGIITLMSCSNGGGCVLCDIPIPINVTPINPPGPDFIPLDGKGSPYSQSAPSSPNYISKSLNQIAVPDASKANTSYIIYNVPPVLFESLQQIQTSSGLSSINMTTLVSTGGQQIVVISSQDPSSPTTPPSVYIVVPANQAAPQFLLSGGEDSSSLDYVLIFPIDQTTGSTSQATPNGNAGTSYSYIVPVPINTNILPALIGNITPNQFNSSLVDTITAGAESAYKLPINISSCTTNINDKTSSVSQTTYNGAYYIAAGTESGNVCIVDATGVNKDNIQSFVESTNFSWTANLANGYTTRYNPRGPVINMSFPTQSSNNILGFWNILTPGANTVYRITGQNTGQGATKFTPTSFWNVTINSKQYSPGTGSSITFSNPPVGAVSMLTDANLNVFVGTNNGKVYKLANGSATWSTTSLSTSTGETVNGVVSLSPTTNPTGIGVIATGYLTNGSLAAFIIQ